ncbi:hypothetical protein GCM10023091_03630 [Ravibacter arvi]|uniref:HTH cro/C1-type domain-containing protein n=1 Tax=Ravibacter arvi TaxID=2051041 RepID=A0ABP8LM50_9BACT
MNNRFEKYKGIHPGIVLERELKKRSLKQRTLALSIGEHPQVLNAIARGKRGLNTSLALKIEKALGIEEGALAVLQTWHDIEMIKQKQERHTPDLSLFRKSLFWDTDINSIDWDRQFKTVILRVFERGNLEEQNEIVRFYGAVKVKLALNDTPLAHVRLT